MSESDTQRRTGRGTARGRLLEAAVDLIRTKGYTATTVDDLCAAAGVTKGAFFHHFDSKEHLAVEAADHWSTTTSALFAAADYHLLATPKQRVLGYIDLRASLIDGPPEAFTCLVGTMAQETFATHDAIRDACADSIFDHAATLEVDLDAALTGTSRVDGIDAAGLARHVQAVLQGSFVLAKAANDSSVVTESLDHLRRYLDHVLD